MIQKGKLGNYQDIPRMSFGSELNPEVSLDELEERADSAFEKWQRLKNNEAPKAETLEAFEELELILDSIGGNFGDSTERRVREKYTLPENIESTEEQ